MACRIFEDYIHVMKLKLSLYGLMQVLAFFVFVQGSFIKYLEVDRKTLFFEVFFNVF